MEFDGGPNPKFALIPQLDTRKREAGEAGEAELERSRAKCAKQLAQASPSPKGSGGDGGPAGKKRDSVEPPPAIVQPTLKEDDGYFQFVRHAVKYITSDMSRDYNNVVTHAVRLTPTGRAALMASQAHIIVTSTLLSEWLSRCK